MRTEKPIGAVFHALTCITPQGVPADQGRTLPPRPPRFLEYDAPHIPLPEVSPRTKGMSVEEALWTRRSVREYGARPLDLEEIARLCFAAQGITGTRYGYLLRTAPSAGARYPCEVYLVVHRAEGLASGLYHYAVHKHALARLRTGDFRRDLWRIGLEQDLLYHAAVVFVITAVVDRVRSRYGERGWRYIYMEAGHISQNLYLEATALGLGSVAVGAFLDHDLHAFLGIDGLRHVALYLHAVGPLPEGHERYT